MKAIHYLNQFFAGFGGEESADLPPGRKEGAVGPGRWLGIEVAATLYCGDNYFAEHPEEALAELVRRLQAEQPDVLVCGPAFASGRYGLACGLLAKAAGELGIPSVCGLEPENPGVAAAEGSAYIVATGANVARMREVLPRMSALAGKLGRGEEVGGPEEEGYLPRGIRLNRLVERTAAARAVEALLGKIRGKVYTEIALGQERVPPAGPVAELGKIRLALISEAGLVPVGNPDRLPTHSAEHWYTYSIEGLSCLSPDRFESIHGGFNTAAANRDPNRLMPLDALRALAAEGRVGEIHPRLYSTTGNSTTLSHAARMGREIAGDLKRSGVLAALLVGT